MANSVFECTHFGPDVNGFAAALQGELSDDKTGTSGGETTQSSVSGETAQSGGSSEIADEKKKESNEGSKVENAKKDQPPDSS